MGCVGGTCPVGPARPRALSRRARHRVAHDWAGSGRAVAVAGTAAPGRNAPADHSRPRLLSFIVVLLTVDWKILRPTWLHVDSEKTTARATAASRPGQMFFLVEPVPSKVLLPHYYYPDYQVDVLYNSLATKLRHTIRPPH